MMPAMNPREKPKRMYLRARRLFRRTTVDATNPHTAATAATAISREISCVGPSDPMCYLRAVVDVGRLPDPTTVVSGSASSGIVRDRSEGEPLAAGFNG
jgi:hypothetical protein